jgi:hypothetical protein
VASAASTITEFVSCSVVENFRSCPNQALTKSHAKPGRTYKLQYIEILVKINNTADRSGFGKYCKSKVTPS